MTSCGLREESTDDKATKIQIEMKICRKPLQSGVLVLRASVNCTSRRIRSHRIRTGSPRALTLARGQIWPFSHVSNRTECGRFLVPALWGSGRELPTVSVRRTPPAAGRLSTCRETMLVAGGMGWGGQGAGGGDRQGYLIRAYLMVSARCLLGNSYTEHVS